MEVWKAIKGYEGYYEISNLGNVCSLSRTVKRKNGLDNYVKGKMLKTPLGKIGYATVSLHKDGERKTFNVHRLVAEQFVPKIEGKEIINHIDGNKANNVYSNLEWVNYSENYKHAISTGLLVLASSNKNGRVQGENNYAAKLTDEAIRFIRNNTVNFGGNISRKAMAEKFGVNITTIANILYRRRWKHVN